jgi:glutamate/tyrosine decarboxylase-like PLP-dependent enzyme
VQTKGNAKATKPVASRLVRDEEAAPPPRHRLPDEGAGGDITYDIITNELFLDGSARLNLATFVTTWMPPHAARLMADTADKNMIDKDEYPQTAELERCCVNILGDLWHAPGDGDATGTSTTGSSEAAMLGGMALKWREAQRPDRGAGIGDRGAHRLRRRRLHQREPIGPPRALDVDALAELQGRGDCEEHRDHPRYTGRPVVLRNG